MNAGRNHGAEKSDNFTLDNLRHFGALKAMSASNATLLGMILLQALLVGSIGYGLWVGVVSLFGCLLGDTDLAFRLPWQLLLLSAAAVILICLFVRVYQYPQSDGSRARHCV